MKAIVLLALSLATLSSLAVDLQRVYIAGYRIGNSGVMENDGRIVATNVNGEVKTDMISVISNFWSASNAYFNVSLPAGQEVKNWFAYNVDPTKVTPSPTDPFAGAVTEYVWSYNPEDTASRWIVVDYDYITYTLAYHNNGGSGSMPSESHIYTNNFNLASNQFSKIGYSFDGWTNTVVVSALADQASVSGKTFKVTYTNKTANLYAKWTPNTYTVTLDPCEGTVDPGSVSVTYDAAWPALPTPTRYGYYFDGWYNDNKYYTRTPTNSNVAITKNATIYAKWTQRLTATFIDPIDSTTQLVYVAYGSMPTAPFTPNHPGYTFSDWSPKLGNITQDTIYTAQFTGTQYFITYHSNFGDPEETRQIDYVYGTAKTALDGATEFPRAGYTFDGWATSASSDQIRFHAGDDIVTFSTEGYALYAVWKPIKYNISFNANGGDGEMEGASVEYGEVYEVPDCGFTKAGVGFTGWTTNVAVTAEFLPGDSVSNLTTTAGATVTFYAVWSEPRYIAFNGNGAGNGDAMAEDVITFEGVETKALVSNKFKKTGYTFGGWATNETKAAALDVAYIDGADVVSTNLWMAIGETNVLFAVWQTNTYTVVFHPNGGTGSMDNQEFVYDQKQALSKCTFASNLMFMGWATNATGVVVFGDEVKVSNLTTEADGMVNLYAVWDNGVLSKAMHCDNLFWTTDGSGTDWDTSTGPNKGHNPSASSPSGSSVDTAVSWTDSMDKIASKKLKVHPELAGSASGKLSFWYKTSSLKSDLYSLSFEVENESMNVALSTEWKKFGPIYVSDIGAVKIYLSIVDLNNGDNCSVEIDQMTWVPAGAEPTDEDRPTISGFAKTADGFTLSVDQSNIGDSFSYQILATNELVGGDWPVKETLSAEDISKGYEIVVEDGEPNMFYKVKVVPK